MKKHIKLIIVLAWMGLIFFFSSQNAAGSTVSTNIVIDWIYKLYSSIVVNNKLTVSEFSLIIFSPIRDLAHFSEFLVLGILAYLFINEYSNKNVVIISCVVCLLYAISDEIHQIFVPGRVCDFKDVLIDTLGAIIGIILIHFINTKCLRNKQ